MMEFQEKISELDEVIKSSQKEKQRLLIDRYKSSIAVSNREISFIRNRVNDVLTFLSEKFEDQEVLMRSTCKSIDDEKINNYYKNFKENAEEIEKLLKNQIYITDAFVTVSQSLLVEED